MKITRTPHASIPVWVMTHPAVQANRTVLHVYSAMYFDSDFAERTGMGDWEAIAERTGLKKSVIYRDIKTMRDAKIIELLGDGSYHMPLDDPSASLSTTMESESTTVENPSTTVERASLTELSELLRGFDQFWDVYPRRDGKKLAQKKCAGLWAKLSLADKRSAYKGAKNYALACEQGLTRAKDPERFITGRVWEDWQEPATPDRMPGRRPAEAELVDHREFGL